MNANHNEFGRRILARHGDLSLEHIPGCYIVRESDHAAVMFHHNGRCTHDAFEAFAQAVVEYRELRDAAERDAEIAAYFAQMES